MSRKHDHVISLGANCQTRRHLQTFSKTKYGEDRTVSHFFDWLWRKSSHDAVIAWLENGLSLDSTTWELHQVGPKWEVMAVAYQFFFPHDFKFSSPSLEICSREMVEQMPAFRSKYEYLRERTIAALSSSSTVAFLTTGKVSEAQFIALERVLAASYHVGDFELFCFPDPIADGAQDFFHPRLISVPVIALPWPGHAASWDNAFRAIDLSLG